MAGDIISMTANAAAGGVFGILGSLAGRVIGFFEKKRDQAFAVKKWENDRLVRAHEIELHKLNLEADRQSGEIELAMLQEKAQGDGFKASIAQDQAIGQGSQWVINVLRLVRPVITFMLWIITAWIYAKSKNPAIADAAVFAATAATLWWFGDRAPSAKITMPKGKFFLEPTK